MVEYPLRAGQSYVCISLKNSSNLCLPVRFGRLHDRAGLGSKIEVKITKSQLVVGSLYFMDRWKCLGVYSIDTLP